MLALAFPPNQIWPFPDATVAIAKSGDIIPQITRVVVEGKESDLAVPTHCKCGSELHLRGIHLMCENKIIDKF